MPWTAARGRNTTQVVAVPPIIEASTRLLPSRAALAYPKIPLSRFDSVARKQLSRTTIELSTIIPTPRTRALMVMTFSENPAAVMAIRDSRIDVGIELPTIKEAFKSPKNRKIIIIEIITDSTMVSATSFSESIIVSAVSFTTSTVRSGSAA